jgi:hypothetical protein
MVSAVETAAFDWPAHQPVAHLPGSLPMGGVVPMTPIYAFADAPAALRLQEPMPTRPVRRDIDLGGLLAFTVEDVITPEEADAMVQATERLG